MIWNYTQIKHGQTWKTRHALNINTNVNFVLVHNISSPSKTHSGASWTPICKSVAIHAWCILYIRKGNKLTNILLEREHQYIWLALSSPENIRVPNSTNSTHWKHIDRTMVVHYNDVIMGTIAYQITSLMTVYSTIYSDADQRKHQSSASLAFVRGIQRRPVNSPHKWPVTRKMFPFDDVIMSFSFQISFLTQRLAACSHQSSQ